jgi:hypothetical protein
MNSRDRKRFAALVKADKALYELWKQSELGGEEMYAINALQKMYIQPSIHQLKAEALRRLAELKRKQTPPKESDNDQDT